MSLNNQRTAEQTVRNNEWAFNESESDRPPILVGQTSLEWLKVKAQEEPETVFTSLAHRIDFHLLKQAFKKVRKNKSCGVDKVTAGSYGENLETNLYNLLQRLRRGQYVAQPVKRIWIDKEGGKKRPIGITVLEDKIVQKAVSMILNSVFDNGFHDFSHGFREGHSQHQALHELREQCCKLNINWIIDADVSGFFDNINKQMLISIIKQRVNDGGILRLVGKWLNAGIDEGGELQYPEKGTPQGAVISPLLSNIFLHTVLDDWYVNEVKPILRGRSFLVRFADDFIIGCEAKSDAYMVLELLKERFKLFDLSLHPEKTKLVPFGRLAKSVKVNNVTGTFNFLGFTFYWSKSRKGYWVIKKKTIGKRLCRFLKSMWEWCRKNRHKPLNEQYEKLNVKLRGYYQYYGVRGNYKALESVFVHIEKFWRHWLGRRSHTGGITGSIFEKIRQKYPLLKPRIIHNI